MKSKISNYYTNMKKILLLFMAMVGTMTAQADNYSFLTFETTDGAKASVAVVADADHQRNHADCRFAAVYSLELKQDVFLNL